MRRGLVGEMRVRDDHENTVSGLAQIPCDERGILAHGREPEGMDEASRRLAIDHLTDDEHALPVPASIEQAAAGLEGGLEDRVEHRLLDVAKAEISPQTSSSGTPMVIEWVWSLRTWVCTVSSTVAIDVFLPRSWFVSAA